MHWTNPAEIALNEEVYIGFVIQYDDNPSGYRELNVPWIEIEPCVADFVVPPGKSKRKGVEYPVDRKGRIVSVLPHVHDHAKEIKLLLNMTLFAVYWEDLSLPTN